jgi:para-nitrobenzyl esterase
MIIGTTLEDSAMRAGTGNFDEAALTKFAQETFKDKAEKILNAYRRVYPNANPSQVQARMLTDRRGRRAATTMAERKTALGRAPAYLYIWNWPSPAFGGKFGAVHGMDVGLSFNNARGMLTGQGPDARKMADILSSVWIAFAKTGDPNCSKVPNWPAFNPETRSTMLFDLECRLENDPAKELRLLWNEVDGPNIPTIPAA